MYNVPPLYCPHTYDIPPLYCPSPIPHRAATNEAMSHAAGAPTAAEQDLGAAAPATGLGDIAGAADVEQAAQGVTKMEVDGLGGEEEGKGKETGCGNEGEKMKQEEGGKEGEKEGTEKVEAGNGEAEEEGEKEGALVGGGTRRFTTTPAWLRGGSLHGYQLEGLNWLFHKWESGQNVILADEVCATCSFLYPQLYPCAPVVCKVHCY